ncbi:MAG: PepSY-associated TM helix domain-containing protein [Pelagimonas sp.]|uniref:PepSY-associated TM helix domain-containing protein n=1 Tax=Pelagimonas sp. TaxID=2073170 RepID=UPI003D6B67E5
MSFRKILFWSHLVAGIATGLVILLLAITGVLLTYEHQLINAAESTYDVTVSDASALPADRLAEIALAETDGKASALVFQNDDSAAVVATIGRSDKLFLDPYSGEALGSGPTATEEFFGTVTTLHRWLSLSGRNDTGAMVTGASNLVFGFLLQSGIYLWLPRIWKWGMLKTKILFRRSYPNAKARDFSWHHVFAFWAAIPLILIILSGAVISYSWASDLVYSAYGEDAPTRRRPGGSQASGPLAIDANGVGLQAVLDRAITHESDWTQIKLTLPKGKNADSVSAMVDTGTGRQLTHQTTLTIAQETGEVVSTSRLSDRSPGMQARMWMRFVHTGEHYGLIGQTIAGLASLFTVFMVYTGLALSYRRLIQPLFRPRKSAA